jgi:hypothetical protein
MSMKNAPPYAGLIGWAKARSTGTQVGIYIGEEAGFDTDEGRYPYSTVCEPHGTICCHPTVALARQHAVHPEGWCETCMTSTEGGTS